MAGALPGPTAALLVREAALAYEMLVRAGVAPGEPTVWIGAGPVARLGQELSRAKGATATAPTDEERALPPEAGAAALRSRLGTTLPPKIFETSARAAGRARAAALAGPGATLVLLAAGAAGAPSAEREAQIPSALLENDVSIVGIAGAHPDLLPELAALAFRGELDLAGAASVRPWDEVNAILAELRAGQIHSAIVTGAQHG